MAMDHGQGAFAHLDLPFFEERHRAFARALDAWAGANVGHAHPSERAAVDDACRALVRALGAGGWLAHAVAGRGHGGSGDAIDTRTICLARETLARHDGLADFAFAMQGLGSGAISLAGSEAQKARWLPRVARGEAIAAFALSEPDAGSDVAAMACAACRDGEGYVLDGEKTWISNGGIADCYVVFARTGDANDPQSKGARGITAFVVERDAPGFSIAERIDVIAPHPLARLRFAGCRVPAAQRIGEEGEGFKIAMRTLDVFRTSVAAAALGFARRAFAEGMARATSRRMFGGVLGDFQLTQAKLADMATEIDAAALLVYRAAWTKDYLAERVTREAAMAKLYATEAAQRVIDAAVQLHGGMGVVSGVPVERLYREIRALRIYEGTSEIQKLVIASQVLAEAMNV
ncbi:MAG TPA: acyl-CoA dehydrogenase family protein, partial [Caldimonas sp.]|nr:acyl-CoA dehydrogenase family protein [Caldimonas sp.]